MKGRLPAVLSLVAVLSAASQATAQAPPAFSESAIEQAIDRGLGYLRDRQGEDGGWVFEREVRRRRQLRGTPERRLDPQYNLGLTALVTLAMVENGVPPSDPAVQNAYSFIKQRAASNDRTYNLSLTVMLLTRMGSREDRPLIRRLAQRLMLGQLDSGGWTYSCPVQRQREARSRPLLGHSRKTGIGDNSNTQFGVLGLWAASRVGVNVDEPLQLAEQRFRASQASTGGWDYRSTGEQDSNAMTAAGLYILTVAAASEQRQARQSAQRPQLADSSENQAADLGEEAAPEGVGKGAIDALAEDDVFQNGLGRVEEFAREIRPRSAPYFLWSLERLGVTLQVQQFGDVDWYARGAKVLLDAQGEGGSWEIAHRGIPDTAFSLLFIRQAHLARDVSYALSGDAPRPFFVLNQEKPQSFGKFSEAISAATSGDVIQVMGNGPYEIAGVTCVNKQLTVRAGEGFEPTFKHKLQLLDDPILDPHLLYAVGLEGGSLTLEGIRIHADPSSSTNPTWTAVSVKDGKLRAANCSITQSIRQTVSGVTLRGRSSLELRNCLLSGFAQAIDAVVSAEQEVRLENCLVYGRVGVQAQNSSTEQPEGLRAHLTRNTFHVAELLRLGELYGSAEFHAEGNIFRTSTFSAHLRPLRVSPERKWDGRRNVFDLARWLGVGGRLTSEVRDLDSWRKYWNTMEESSIIRSAPFAVYRRIGPFRHDVNPNDWRMTIETILPDLAPNVQVGCDPYLVGAGQPYYQFKESAEYDQWRENGSVVQAEAQDAN